VYRSSGSRRWYLTALAGITIGLAGCSSNGDGDSTPDSDREQTTTIDASEDQSTTQSSTTEEPTAETTETPAEPGVTPDWTFDTAGSINSAPTVRNGMVYVGDDSTPASLS